MMRRGYPSFWEQEHDGFGFDVPSLFERPRLRNTFNDEFLDDLRILHLKDNFYFIALPRNVSFKHIGISVKDITQELILTYLPTKATCEFRLPDDVDVDRVEAKRYSDSRHGILLYLPKKVSVASEQDFGSFSISDSSSVDSGKSRSRCTTPEVFEVAPLIPDGEDSELKLSEDNQNEGKNGEIAKTSLYTAIHPISREEVTFEEFEVPSDHDCAFHCIGVSRQEACELLLENQDKEEIRKLVAPEIEESFIGYQLPKEMEQQPIVQDLRKKFFEATEKVSEGVRQAKEKLESIGIPCENMDAKQIVTKFRWCQSVAILEVVRELMKSINVLKNAEKRIEDYCLSKEAYVSFVNFYLAVKGNWAGYLRSVDNKQRSSCLDAIAHLKGLRLFIWIVSSGNKVELVHEFPASSDNRDLEVIHMLHTHKLSHFNLLVEI